MLKSAFRVRIRGLSVDCRDLYRGYDRFPAFPPVPPAYAEVVTVAKSGGDFASIKAAVDSIVDATAIKPYTVRVFAGVYTEDPIVMKPFVSVVGQGQSADVVIVASTTTAALVTGAAGTGLLGVTLSGANGVGGVGYRLSAAGTTAHLFDVSVLNCRTGVDVDGAGVVVIANQLGITTLFGNTTNDGVVAANGGVFVGHDCGIQNVGGTLANGLRSAATSRITWRSGNVLLAAQGAFADGGDLIIQSGELRQCVDALVVTDGFCRISGSNITGSTGFDIRLTTAGSTSIVSGVNYAQDQLDIASGATFTGTLLHDADPASNVDSAQQVFGELHVGKFDEPAEASIGGGDSHTFGMIVFSNDNGEIGTWVDNTVAAKSRSGSTFALLQGIGVDQAAYFGGDQPFPGIKTDVTVAVVLGGTGILVWEYWDGGAWTSFFVMAADANAPYEAHAQAVFERVQNDQVRYGDISGQATKLLNGETKFWTRVRVTGAITSVPTLESVKLHTDRSEINADGFLEFFGAGRPPSDLPVQFADISGAAPGSTNVDVSASIVLVGDGNRFNNNVEDSRGAIIEIPVRLDTSLPLTLTIDWYSPATGGNVELEVDFAEVKIGDVIDGTIPESGLADVQAAPAVINTLTTTSFSIPVESLVPGEFLAARFFRDATAGNPDDTLAGNVIIFNVTVEGTIWHS